MNRIARFRLPVLLLLAAAVASPSPARSADRPARVRFADRPAVAEIDFADTTLERAVEHLRTLTRADIVVRWGVLKGAGVDRAAPVKLRLWEVTPGGALHVVLRYVDHDGEPLAWQEGEDGTVTISTRQDHSIGPPKPYDVRDLVDAIVAGDRPLPARAGPGEGEERTRAEIEDELTLLIMESVLPESWRDNGGTTGSIRTLGGRFIITQSQEGHRQVEELLRELSQEFVKTGAAPSVLPQRVTTFPSAPTPPSPPAAGPARRGPG